MHYHPIKTLLKVFKGTPLELTLTETSLYITWNSIKLKDIEKKLKNQDWKVKTAQRVYSAQSPVLSATNQIYLIMYDLVKYRWKRRSFYLFEG